MKITKDTYLLDKKFKRVESEMNLLKHTQDTEDVKLTVGILIKATRAFLSELEYFENWLGRRKEKCLEK